MPLYSYCGTITAPAATGSQSYTGVGFKPKVLIAYSVASTALGSTNAAITGYGFATSSTSQASVSSQERNALDPNQCNRRHSNTSLISCLNAGATVSVEAALTSFDTDGFTLNWTTTTVSTNVFFIALGGSGLTGATIKEFTSPAGTGSQAYTGVGFSPESIVFIGTGLTSAPAATDSSANGFMIGTCCAALNQSSFSVKSQDNVSTSNSSHLSSTTSAVNLVEPGEGTNYLASVTSMDSDGFTLNWATTAGSGSYFWALCLNGVRAFCSTFTQPASTGNQSYTGTVNKPAVVLISTVHDTTAGTPVASYLLGTGGMTQTGEANISATSPDATAAPYTTRRRSFNTTTIDIINSAGTVIAAAAKVSLNSNGFTLNWTTTDGTARIFGYLAIGPGNPTGGFGHFT